MSGDGSSTGGQKPGWTPPILRTVATEGVGIPELVTWIERHGEMLRSSGEWQRRERDRLETELDSLLRDSLVSRWREALSDQRYQEVLSRLAERRLSPHEAVEELIDGEKC